MMVKKTLGYIELEWTCPSCGTRNPGTEEVCQSCGTKMPEDIEFDLPAQQELDTSAETATRVATGPDIHCPYCGARNPANATSCSQCGGDLTEEGIKRAKGKVLGAYQTAPVPDVTCPHCGASNPATATKCSSCGGNLERERAEKASIAAAPRKKSSPVLVGIFLAALLGCALVVYFVFLRGSSEAIALVKDVEWTYTIGLEELGPETHEDWRDQVPSDARLGSCSQKVRRTVSDPVPGATEVCGTPYVQDTGTGQGEVVQDCEYRVPDDWCEYTVDEWKPAGEKVASGHDLNPAWPVLNLKSDQQEGGRDEEYKVILDADGEDYVYNPNTLQDFRRFEIGSKWIVETNVLGGVTSVQPAD